MEHAQQHDAFIDGNTDTGKLESQRIVLSIVDDF